MDSTRTEKFRRAAIPGVVPPADRFRGEADAHRPLRELNAAGPGEEDWSARRDPRPPEEEGTRGGLDHPRPWARRNPGRETPAAPSYRRAVGVVGDSLRTHKAVVDTPNIAAAIAAADSARSRPWRGMEPRCTACGSSQCVQRPVP